MRSPITMDRPRRLLIPRSRRLVIDLLRLSARVPTTAHDRITDLSAVAAAREQAAQRISWPILFIKAFAIVAAKYPPLRQIYMRWPWPHLYQHPNSVAIVVTHREVEEVPWIFWSKFTQPETTPLSSLQSRLNDYLTKPVPVAFQKQWQLSALPTWLRRIVWWSLLNVFGQRRVKRCGTFFLTTISSRGAEIRHPPGFLTSGLTFGPIDEHGRSRVTLAYDHRLLDGRMVADILADLEQTLNSILAEELVTLPAADLPANRRAA